MTTSQAEASTSPVTVPTLQDRAGGQLAALGWSGREAEWLALVALHSGVFTRSQWCQFFDGANREAARVFVRALIEKQLAIEDEGPPHVVITCRAAGGYSPAKELQATWTIPVQGDFPEKLRSRIAKLGTDPYPEPVKGGLDRALSAVVDGMPVTIDKRFSPDIGVEPTIKFRWELRFEPDAERARVARIMALHCKGR